MSDHGPRCACVGQDRYRGDWCKTLVDREGDRCRYCQTTCPYRPTPINEETDMPFSPMALRYRKKPVVIQAMRLTSDNAPDVASWCGGRVERTAKASDPSDVSTAVLIPTLEGTMTASAGDYVIKGVQGEFYPCKPDIFEATYDAA